MSAISLDNKKVFEDKTMQLKSGVKHTSNKPLISVITIVFNGEIFLDKTIQSVINQSYENIEHIIIDGGSSDGTLEIIRKYEQHIDYWNSEKDNGVYDATLCVMIINIKLNYMLIPRLGAEGSAWVTLISQFFAAYLSLLFWKETRINFLKLSKSLILVRMFDFKKIYKK
jgi:hypothetical protein